MHQGHASTFYRSLFYNIPRLIIAHVPTTSPLTFNNKHTKIGNSFDFFLKTSGPQILNIALQYPSRRCENFLLQILVLALMLVDWVLMSGVKAAAPQSSSISNGS